MAQDKRDKIWMLWSEFNRYLPTKTYTTKQLARDAAIKYANENNGVVVYVLEAGEFAFANENTATIRPTN
jgi:hypothetical protein